MSSILRALYNRFGTIGYRTKLVLFVFLFALALSSAFLQLSYGYMFARSILSGAPECEDYDIVDLALHHQRSIFFRGDEIREYIGKFKTRGFLYVYDTYPYSTSVSLTSFAFPQAKMAFKMPSSECIRYLPTNGSFVEVRGELYRYTSAYGQSSVYGSIQSWQHCSIAYEVLVDLLAFGEISGTFVLLVWSGRVIGSSIASRAYLKNKAHARSYLSEPTMCVLVQIGRGVAFGGGT